MTTENSKKRIEGPRWAVTIRLARDTQSRIKVAAQKWGVAPTAAVTKLVQIGLDAEAGAYDPNRELDAIGYALNDVASRLDRRDKLSAVTARAAIKSAWVLIHQIKASSNAAEVLKRLDAAAEKAIEEALK